MISIDERLAAFNQRLWSSVPDRPVLAGAIVTAVAMYVLFLVPNLVSFGIVRRGLNRSVDLYLWDNPLLSLQYLGGIVGGYVAGYLSRDTWSSWFRNGILAIVLGVGIYYVVSNSWSALQFFLVGELTISILMVIYIQSLLFVAIPFGLVYLFEAILSSPIGYLTSKVVASRFTSVGESEGEVTPTPIVARWFVASGVLVVLFVFTWLFVFYTHAQL